MQSLNKLEKLINQLCSEGVVKSEAVRKAMVAVDRGDFVHPADAPYAYSDCPQRIGYNATISAPHMHAYALEFLSAHLKDAKRALDVGSGSGYLCAAMRLMMQNADARVVGIEHVQELVNFSISNLSKHFENYLKDNSILIRQGDGRKGFAQEGPYQVIHVGAAAEKIPDDLVSQLDKGGRMVIPVGSGTQKFQVVDKDLEGKITVKDIIGVVYVPLTDLKKQVG